MKLKDLIIFDDFQKVESPYEGYDLYASYFNKLFIKNNTALLIRLEVIVSWLTCLLREIINTFD